MSEPKPDTCSDCQKSPAPLTCGVCDVSLCKACAQFTDQNTVSLLQPMPTYFTHGVFCSSCWGQKIEPEIDAYNETLKKAGEVNIFYKTESKESRFIRRAEKPIKVKDCIDHEFAVMKLAFMAADAGFNILLDVEIELEKTRNGGWQSSICHGVGIPGLVDQAMLNRRFASSPN